MTFVKEPSSPGAKASKKPAYRDRSEWIGVQVPAIVSQELFDKVQERLSQSARGYRQPRLKTLLAGRIQCGVCGRAFSAYRRYFTRKLVTKGRVVCHKAAYICNHRKRYVSHAPGFMDRCLNKEVATHRLDNAVLQLIRDIMIDPEKLRACTVTRPQRRSIKAKPERKLLASKPACGTSRPRKPG